MLKLKSLSALIATTVVMAPIVLSLRANAETNIYQVRNSVVARKPSRKKVVRVVRLRNGDIRLPNGNVVPAKRVVKLRNGYRKLPKGHIINQNGDFFDAKDLVIIRNRRRRLPNGIIIDLDD